MLGEGCTIAKGYTIAVAVVCVASTEVRKGTDRTVLYHERRRQMLNPGTENAIFENLPTQP